MTRPLHSVRNRLGRAILTLCLAGGLAVAAFGSAGCRNTHLSDDYGEAVREALEAQEDSTSEPVQFTATDALKARDVHYFGDRQAEAVTPAMPALITGGIGPMTAPTTTGPSGDSVGRDNGNIRLRAK